MPSKGGGGYGGGPYANANIPIVEATPVAEAVPVEATAAAGGYVPPTYDGTYARPPPVSPYASAIAEPAASQGQGSEAGGYPPSYQQGQGSQRQQGQGQGQGQGGRAPLPLEPYPLLGQPQPQAQPHRHQGQGQQQGQGQAVMGQAVMGQPVQVQHTGGQPMTGEQLVLVQVNPRQPFPCQCPHCAAVVTTELSFVANGFTFLGCLGLALLGCYPCAVLPFCIPDCKSAVHVCPRCRGVIAVA